jgi:hypothetical protein
VALMFCYVPANMIALGSLPQDMMKNGAGLYNLMRDLGGAIGLASIGTIMNARLYSLEPADRGHQSGAAGGAALPRYSRQPLRVADPG